MDEYLGMVKIFAGTFAPRGFAYCNGQLLSIAQNTALFSLLGVTYGGNGQTTFGLPDLRGRAPVGTGQGPGLQNYPLGSIIGAETVTLITQNMPVHSHSVSIGVTSTEGDTRDPSGAILAKEAAGVTAPYSTGAANASLGGVQSTPQGGGQPFNILQPLLAINYVICISGAFPSRN